MGLVVLWHVEALQTRDQTLVSCVGRWILNHFAQAVLHVGATFLLMFKVYLINGFFSLPANCLCFFQDQLQNLDIGSYLLTVILPQGSGLLSFLSCSISLSLLNCIIDASIQHIMSVGA